MTNAAAIAISVVTVTERLTMPTSLSLQYAGELVSELAGAVPAILAGGMTSGTRFLISHTYRLEGRQLQDGRWK
jgi:hypothetical protein